MEIRKILIAQIASDPFLFLNEILTNDFIDQEIKKILRDEKKQVLNNLQKSGNLEDIERELSGSLEKIFTKIDEEVLKNILIQKINLIKILVLCRLESRLEGMQLIFPKLLFPNVEITLDELYEFNHEVENYSLIVYDNFPVEMRRPKLENGLKEIIKNTSKFILFHSPVIYTELNDKYSERIYFSNSPFSIHARLKEMLLYIQYTQYNKLS